MSDQNTQRIDQLLVSLGLFASRSRARDAVQRGTVKVDGKLVTKAGAVFGEDVVIEIDDPAQDYVSRAALKLAAALDHFKLDPSGHNCLDVGASTGGFTEVLLERSSLPSRPRRLCCWSSRSSRPAATRSARAAC
jgi:23S rRNA (cytidine1920-2'-O)/16S rRNA (cytidine1409-2'-O)-methyltransferase